MWDCQQATDSSRHGGDAADSALAGRGGAAVGRESAGPTPPAPPAGPTLALARGCGSVQPPGGPRAARLAQPALPPPRPAPSHYPLSHPPQKNAHLPLVAHLGGQGADEAHGGQRVDLRARGVQVGGPRGWDARAVSTAGGASARMRRGGGGCTPGRRQEQWRQAGPPAVQLQAAEGAGNQEAAGQPAFITRSQSSGLPAGGERCKQGQSSRLWLSASG